MQREIRHSILFFLIATWFICCYTVKDGVNKAQDDQIPYTQLVDLLRNRPGLRIQGSGTNIQVIFRGERSLLLNNEPLFVLDGNMIGNTYREAANAVDPNQIAHIKILSPANASFYGVNGANGVIEITTRN